MQCIHVSNILLFPPLPRGTVGITISVGTGMLPENKKIYGILLFVLHIVLGLSEKGRKGRTFKLTLENRT